MKVIVTNQWLCKSIDIKAAFMQSHFIDRNIFVNPLKEAKVPADKVWNLNTTVYGLAEASRTW